MQYDQDILATIKEYNAQQLAGCADSYSDNDESAGFFELIRDNVLERTDDIDADDWKRLMVEDYDGSAHEIADQAPNVYTSRLWNQFLGTRAYQEDPSELGAQADDMEKAAGVCLYMIAERLVHALADEIQEGITDNE